jgi:hypothetical protein
MRCNRGSSKNWPILVRQPAEGAQAQQSHQGGPEQVARPVEVAGDEVVALQPPQFAGERDKSPVPVGLAVPADATDLLGHPVRLTDHVEAGPVGVEGPVRRVEVGERQPVVEFLPDGGEWLGDQLGHGEHGRTGVELIPVHDQPPGAGRRHRLALQHDDLAPGPGQMQGAGEPAEAGAHDDDPIRPASDGSHRDPSQADGAAGPPPSLGRVTFGEDSWMCRLWASSGTGCCR